MTGLVVHLNVNKGGSSKRADKLPSLCGNASEAVVVLVETKSAFTEMPLIVRKGEMVVEGDHSGWDAGLFATTKPDLAELEAAAKGVAEKMIGEL
ncbi:hypothetical protein [Lentzea sp. NPDC055074]